MYHQTDWRVPDALFRLVGDTYLEEYRGMRLQLGAAGPHVVPGVWPLPVRVTHVISPPLALDHDVDPGDPVKLEEAQVSIWAQCQALLDRAVALRRGDSDLLDRALRVAMRGLQEIGF
ncbi:MAG: hypothetical protein ACREQ9_05035 [Candidatus Binatia bacterium]